TLGVPEEAQGKQIRCPKCQLVFQVPRKTSEQVTTSPAKSLPPMKSVESIRCSCSKCQTLLQLPAHLLGKQVCCPKCNEIFLVPLPQPAIKKEEALIARPKLPMKRANPDSPGVLFNEENSPSGKPLISRPLNKVWLFKAIVLLEVLL